MPKGVSLADLHHAVGNFSCWAQGLCPNNITSSHLVHPLLVWWDGDKSRQWMTLLFWACWSSEETTPNLLLLINLFSPSIYIKRSLYSFGSSCFLCITHSAQKENVLSQNNSMQITQMSLQSHAGWVRIASETNTCWCCLWVETLLSVYFLYVPPRCITPRCTEAEQPTKLIAKW